MRLAVAQTLSTDIATARPECRVRRVFDGSRGYAVVLVEPGGKLVQVHSRADWRRMRKEGK